MGNRVVRFIRTIVVFCYSMSFSTTFAADGDIFTANTVEGILMTFQVVSEIDKTCCVYAQYPSNACIPRLTDGIITIPSMVNTYTVINIGDYAFDFCSNLESVTIPKSVKSIGIDAFSCCWSLKNVTIPESVTSIGAGAFYGCTSLINIIIPNSVITIGNYAFNRCTNLTSITVDERNPMFDSRNDCNAIIETASNTLIMGCKNTVIPNTVTSIADHAFFECYNLKGITIPESVISIGDGAFRDCSSLTDITIPNSVTIIAGNTFYNCSSLTHITIPNSVTIIDHYAFSWCTNLRDVSLGNSVTYVGIGAFEVCTSLTNITIPNSVTRIEDIAFRKCTALTNLIVEEGNTKYDSRDGCNAVIETATNTLIIGCKNSVIPNTVTSIGKRAFEDCSSLTDITIPNSVTSIETRAFYGCKELVDIVSEIVEPFAISDDTFQYYNDGFAPLNAKLTVPFDTKVKYEETNGWKQLAITENHPDDGAVFLAETIDGVEVAYKVTDGQEWLCQFGEGDGKTAFDAVGVKQITIPAQVKGCTVTSIADGAFSGCTSLLSVSFPETVTAIDTEILKDCCDLAAILWNAETVFPKEALVSAADNPNLLLYVKNKSYAPNTVGNVVVNGTAPDIILKDADHGSNFYCPKAFTTTRIEYEHEYTMKTGYGECRGWETIALPFDVTRITHEKGMALVPLTSDWNPKDSNSRPFWLYEESANGWQPATAIKANTPYLISMPNNDTHYESSYNVNGRVAFVGENVQVQPSQSLNIAQRGDRSFVPNFQHQPTSTKIYALNINDASKFNEGSVFIRELRAVHPFEAYMTLEGSNAGIRSIPVFDNETTGMTAIPVSGFGNTDAIYNLNGQRVNSMSRGIYIQNGRKIVKK